MNPLNMAILNALSGNANYSNPQESEDATSNAVAGQVPQVGAPQAPLPQAGSYGQIMSAGLNPTSPPAFNFGQQSSPPATHTVGSNAWNTKSPSSNLTLDHGTILNNLGLLKQGQ